MKHLKKNLELKKLNAKYDLIAPSTHSHYHHLSALVTLYILIVYLHVNSLIYWYFNILFQSCIMFFTPQCNDLYCNQLCYHDVSHLLKCHIIFISVSCNVIFYVICSCLNGVKLYLSWFLHTLYIDIAGT